MSWSLQLQNGDLTISGTKFGQATGSNKLVQDLRCALLEPRGSDDMHPSYGSLIDGGIDEFGNQVASIIGTSRWDLAAARIENEIRRIAEDLQRRQAARAAQDRYTYGDSTLSAAELLVEITGLEMFQAQDMMMVRVTLQTGQGASIEIDVPIVDSV